MSADVDRLILQAAVLKAAKAAHDADRADVLAELGRPGNRRVTDLGSVAVANGPSGTVVDAEGPFEAWVRANHPEALVSVVNPAWRKTFLASLVDGDTDPATGEVVPGVSVRAGVPRLVVTPGDAAYAQVGVLFGTVLGELETGA